MPSKFENDVSRTFSIRLSLRGEGGNSQKVYKDENQLSSDLDIDSEGEINFESDDNGIEFDHHNNSDDVCTKIRNSDTKCKCYTCYCGKLQEQLLTEQNRDPIPIKYANSKSRRLNSLGNCVLQNSSRLKPVRNAGLQKQQQQSQQMINAVNNRMRGNKTTSSKRQQLEKVRKEETPAVTSESSSVQRERKDTRNYAIDRLTKTNPLMGKKLLSSKKAHDDNLNFRTPRSNSSVSSVSDTDMDSDTESNTSSCSSAKIRNNARKHIEDYNRRKSSKGVNLKNSLLPCTNDDVDVVIRRIENENLSEESDFEIFGNESRSKKSLKEKSKSVNKVIDNKSKLPKKLKETSLNTNDSFEKENESEINEVFGNESASKWRLKAESSDSDLESVINCVSDSCMEISGDEGKIPMPGVVFNYSGYLPISANNNRDVRNTLKPCGLVDAGIVKTTLSKQKSKLTPRKPQSKLISHTPKKKIFRKKK